MESYFKRTIKSLINFTVKMIITAIIFTCVGMLLLWYFQIGLRQLYARVSGPPLRAEVRNLIEEQARTISDPYGAFGSGCEVVPGFAFTARHLVEDTILDANKGMDVSLKWEDKTARVYWYSNTVNDYAVITTTPPGTKFPKDQMKFSTAPPKEGQILHTFSSPGGIPDLYQKLEVIKIQPADGDRLPVLTFKSDYVQSGISGGCVVDENGAFVGIIKNKQDYTDPKLMSFGEITVIKSAP